jgi:Putative zinc-finger
MNCRSVEELILENLDAPLTDERGIELEAHVAACGSCRRFLDQQLELQRMLAARYTAPALSAQFRKGLRRRVGADKRRAIWHAMPDILHLAGGFAATAVCVWLVPLPAPIVASSGVAFTLGTYLLETLVRFTLEELDGV